MIWDKKWVSASSEGMFVYSHEWREDRSPLAWIPYSQLVKVGPVHREFMALPNTLALTIALPWKDDTSVFMPTPLSSSWKDMVVEAGNAKNFSVTIFIACSSLSKYTRWKSFLECHIARSGKNKF